MFFTSKVMLNSIWSVHIVHKRSKPNTSNIFIKCLRTVYVAWWTVTSIKNHAYGIHGQVMFSFFLSL